MSKNFLHITVATALIIGGMVLNMKPVYAQSTPETCQGILEDCNRWAYGHQEELGGCANANTQCSKVAGSCICVDKDQCAQIECGNQGCMFYKHLCSMYAQRLHRSCQDMLEGSKDWAYSRYEGKGLAGCVNAYKQCTQITGSCACISKNQCNQIQCGPNDQGCLFYKQNHYCPELSA